MTMKKSQRGVAGRKTGMYPKSRKVQHLPEGKGRTLPEYLEAHEINALIATASNPKAKLLILLQWRAGLRVAEALAVTAADLMLESDSPTLRVHRGKGGKARIVPVHPELQNALQVLMDFGNLGERRIIDAHRSTAWRWVIGVVAEAQALGRFPAGRKVGTHTLRHSYARHLLRHGILVNYLSRWLGHSSIQTTLIYLELEPDPSGALSQVP